MPVEPTVVFSSERVSNGNNTEHIKFTLNESRTTVSGASVSTGDHTELIFAPGSYIVRIHFPSIATGEGEIAWKDGDVSIQPPPSAVSPDHGETWVQFGVQNDPNSGGGVFPFELSYTGTSTNSKDWPTIVSDPPPSVVLQSS